MDSQQVLIERFKRFYVDIKQAPLTNIGDVYASDVIFKDPIQEVRGLEKLHAYMSELCVNVQSGRFEYLDQMVGDNKAYIKWNMHFKHPKLGQNTLTVRGMSQIEFHDLIYFHEDVYDLGSMLYEHIPILGFAVKRVKKGLVMPS